MAEDLLSGVLDATLGKISPTSTGGFELLYTKNTFSSESNIGHEFLEKIGE